METLKDKIMSLEAQIEANNDSMSKYKEAYEANIASLKEENKKLAKVVKKLKDTEASIESIFSGADKSE